MRIANRGRKEPMEAKDSEKWKAMSNEREGD